MKHTISFEKGYVDTPETPYMFVEIDLDTLTYTEQSDDFYEVEVPGLRFLGEEANINDVINLFKQKGWRLY